MATRQAVKEIMWIKKLLKDVYGTDQLEIVLKMDNQSAIQLIKNPVFHKRTKHINVRFNYIREKYEEKNFQLEHVDTHEQLADVLTKPLTRTIFEKHRDVICCKMKNLRREKK